MDIIALRSFGLSYIIMDSIFIVAFCLLLFFTKRRLSLIFALCGGLLYFIVDYGIFHLATGSRHIVNADMFWVLLWMSFSYGITNFAWIWLCLRRDEKLTEWTLLIVLWWIVCPILDDAITGGGQQITIWRETGAYHWFMAVFLIVSYVALIVWNLFQKDKNKQFKLLWLFAIGVAVQFGWEVTLLLGGIRSVDMDFLQQIKVLVVNSLMETNLGLPAIYCIYLAVTSKFTERCAKRDIPVKFLDRLSESNNKIRC